MSFRVPPWAMRTAPLLAAVPLSSCGSRLSIDLFSGEATAEVTSTVSAPNVDAGTGAVDPTVAPAPIPAGSGGSAPTSTGAAGASNAGSGGSGGSAGNGVAGSAGDGGNVAGMGVGGVDASAPVATGTPPDAGADAGADDAGIGPLPRHRYAFSGNGTTAIDELSGANGVVVGGATLDGNGRVLLDGNDDYVDLPNGLVSSFGNATFSAWVEWNGNNCWHRIFSFGNTVQGEDMVGDGETELFMTPVNCPVMGGETGMTVLFQLGATPELNAEVVTPVAFGIGVNRHAVLVVDDTVGELRVFLDGQMVGASPTTLHLSDLVDENNWLGRSQWEQDFNLPGVFDSFEIYDVALDATDVRRLYELGPR